MIFPASTYSTVPLPSALNNTRESRATSGFKTCTYDRSFRHEAMELPDAACSIPSGHGSHHHAQGMESTMPRSMQSGWYQRPSNPSSFGSTTGKSPSLRAFTTSVWNPPFSSTCALACAMVVVVFFFST